MRWRLWKVGLTFAIFLALGAGAVALWARAQLTGSLPVLGGNVHVEGLSAPVIVTRDALGIPTVRGASRADVARATGFLHAQDRFFQMDLARRRAAGELAALVGSRALPIDREIRVHRFRAEAQKAIASMAPEERSLIEAYTAGVNAGLRALGASPFEYLLLRQQPRAWLPEDSLLVVLSMFITLQDYQGSYESTLGTIDALLPHQMCECLAPMGPEWDSPLVGDIIPVPPIPGPLVYDLRSQRSGRPSAPLEPQRREDIQLPSSNSQLPSLIAWTLGIEHWAL